MLLCNFFSWFFLFCFYFFCCVCFLVCSCAVFCLILHSLFCSSIFVFNCLNCWFLFFFCRHDYPNTVLFLDCTARGSGDAPGYNFNCPCAVNMGYQLCTCTGISAGNCACGPPSGFFSCCNCGCGNSVCLSVCALCVCVVWVVCALCVRCVCVACVLDVVNL